MEIIPKMLINMERDDVCSILSFLYLRMNGEINDKISITYSDIGVDVPCDYEVEWKRYIGPLQKLGLMVSPDKNINGLLFFFCDVNSRVFDDSVGYYYDLYHCQNKLRCIRK